MVAFNTVKPGDILYDCHTHRAGNTKMRVMGVWQVRVISVDEAGGFVVASWNGNKPERYYTSSIRRWRRTPKKEAAR